MNRIRFRLWTCHISYMSSWTYSASEQKSPLGQIGLRSFPRTRGKAQAALEATPVRYWLGPSRKVISLYSSSHSIASSAFIDATTGDIPALTRTGTGIENRGGDAQSVGSCCSSQMLGEGDIGIIHFRHEASPGTDIIYKPLQRLHVGLGLGEGGFEDSQLLIG